MIPAEAEQFPGKGEQLRSEADEVRRGFWCRGKGGQPLYRVLVSVEAGGHDSFTNQDLIFHLDEVASWQPLRLGILSAEAWFRKLTFQSKIEVSSPRVAQMRAQLCFAGIALVTASSAWLALAQQPSPKGTLMSDRDKAGLRGPVKSVLVEQNFSASDGRRLLTSTRTEYAADGRMLEVRQGNSDGSQWVNRYTYQPDGLLIKTASGEPGSAPSSETTYAYDDAQRLVEIRSGGRGQIHYQYDDKGRKSVVESYDSRPLPPNTAYAAHWEGSDLGFAPYPGVASLRRTTSRRWRLAHSSEMQRETS